MISSNPDHLPTSKYHHIWVTATTQGILEGPKRSFHNRYPISQELISYGEFMCR